MRIIISAGLLASLCVGPTQALQPHQTRLECVNSELQKYSQPTESALAVAHAVCKERYDKREADEAKKIKGCGFKYDDAVKEGHSHQEIVEFIKTTKSKCLN